MAALNLEAAHSSPNMISRRRKKCYGQRVRGNPHVSDIYASIKNMSCLYTHTPSASSSSSSSSSSRREREREKKKKKKKVYTLCTPHRVMDALKQLHFPIYPVVFPMGASYTWNTWNTPTAFCSVFCFDAGHHTPNANCTRVCAAWESSWKLQNDAPWKQ